MDKTKVSELIQWIKEKTEGRGVVLGMSGGKDSLITAKLCCKALGEDKVFGVIMPNGPMKDQTIAIETCKLLGINFCVIDVGTAYEPMIALIKKQLNQKELPDVTTTNLPPRLRMSTLYAVAATRNSLVANTSNLSEATIGYCTKWGDNVGDFAPLLSFTKTEVCEIGTLLGLPDELVHKKPEDGLTGKTDEDKLGFTYKELDEFIREGKIGEHYDIIKTKIANSAHKRQPISKFEYKVMDKNKQQ